MSILDEWLVFDINIWIFGLRRVSEIPECSQLLGLLGRLHVALPRQILQELHANLSENEISSLFHLLSRLPERVKISWDKTKPEIIAKYQALGCKLGVAVVAAYLEELGIDILISENRDFLEEVKNLPFRRLSATQAPAELQETKK